MFELPEAKRVRRADLNADDAASGEDGGYDAELEARLNAQIAKSLGLDESDSQPKDLAVTPSHLTGAGDEEDADNDGFEFRLFSSTRPSQKVVLEDDAGQQGDGGLAFPRPASYYRFTNLTADQKRQYTFAAVSGDDVIARSKDPVWGLQLPWRVMSVAVTRKRRPGESACTSEEVAATKKKKGKPNKKQRISLRKRAKLREETEKTEAQKLMAREEHTKDKKKRMNRLKKLRKRAKSKQEKAESKAGEGEAGAEDFGDESAGSD
ncbi:hypothetical protein B0J13DRAFT_262459 [Dactylonectria estremocensis]|uniref:Uncharacterized protein n=1 Tax=Dactylonectria estremocensis TaxID=1079267 RepID=A0A9P9JAF4_9HYPO|nr:hypothetical protein B0J13DRAFT_262459 [Dactylonectria estremocensis]